MFDGGAEWGESEIGKLEKTKAMDYIGKPTSVGFHKEMGSGSGPGPGPDQGLGPGPGAQACPRPRTRPDQKSLRRP